MPERGLDHFIHQQAAEDMASIEAELAGTTPPTPDQTPPADAPPAVPDLALEDLQQRLDVARTTYLDLKKKFPRTPDEYATEEKAYREVRAEYVGTDVEKFLTEKDKLVEAEIAAMSSEKGFVKKAYDQYKKLGQYNLIEHGAKLFGKDFKATGRIAKMVNARTAISFGLLGVGVVAGAGTAVGVGAIALRRGFSGISTAVGSYDVTMLINNSARRRGTEKDLSSIDTLSTQKLGEMMAEMQARGGLDGKSMDDLKNDPLYAKVAERYNAATTQEISKFDSGYIKERMADLERDGMTQDPEYLDLKNLLAEQIETFFTRKINAAEDEIKRAQKKEKVFRALVATGAAALGTIVGSGALAKAFGHKTELGHAKPSAHEAITHKPPVGSSAENHLPSRFTVGRVEQPPTTPGHMSPIEHPNTHALDDLISKKIPVIEKPTFHLKPDALAHETAEADTVVTVGARGFEGALLDLKTSNPAQYGKMLDWLKAQDYNHGVNADKPGALVHRYMLNYAKEHGMTIDEAGKNLSRIMKGEVSIHADGSIGIDEHHVQFIAESHAPAIDHAAPEAPQFEEVTVLDNPLESHPLPDIHPSEFATTPHGLAERLAEAHDIAAASVSKSSDALELVLGHGSRKFLKETFQLNYRDLNKIGKQTINDFINDYKHGSPTFQEHYKKLFDGLPEKVRLQGSGQTIRQFVLAAAKKFKEPK